MGDLEGSITIISIIIQIFGMYSDIFCIIFIAYLYKYKPNIVNRPKILMTFIAFISIILNLNSIIPRYLILPFMITNGRPHLSALIIQSIRDYLDNISLYMDSFTITIIAWDRFYALTKVFINPFDGKSTKRILITIWLLSIILASPYMIFNFTDYFDYYNSDVIQCNILDENYGNIFGKTIHLPDIYKQLNDLFISIEFVIPTLLVSVFTGRMIYEIFNDYFKVMKGIQTSNCMKSLQKCDITKNLLLVLFIFIFKNISNIIVKYKLFSQDYYFIRSRHFIFYQIYRLTNSLNSFIYFWLSSEFRQQFKYYFLNNNFHSTVSSRVNKLSSNSNIINV